MASTVANNRNSSNTLTLHAFHAGSSGRQAQESHRITGINATNLQISPRSPRIANHALVPANGTNTRNARNTNAASSASRPPTIATARNAIRTPTLAITTSSSGRPSARQTASPRLQVVQAAPKPAAKVHAITPISGTSIDSVLHSYGGEHPRNAGVPDRIKPRAEAINTASPMVAINLSDTTISTPMTFYAHSDVLTRHPSVLQTLVKEAQQKQRETDPPPATLSITLPNSDPKSLNIYLNWLYTSNIHAGHRSDDTTSPEATTGLARLTKCYILGIHLRSPFFRDAILDAIAAFVITVRSQGGKTTLTLLMQRLKQYYAQLPPGCKGRKMFVRFYAHYGDWRLLEKGDPEDFLLEVREVLKKGVIEEPMAVAGRCGFHEHGAGEGCYRQGLGA